MTVVDDVIAVLRTAPKGMLSRDIAQVLGHKHARWTSKYIDRAVQAGMALKAPESRGPEGGGRRVMRYFTPEHAVGAMEENAIRVAELKRLAVVNKKASEKRRRRRAQAERRQRESDGELAFVHLVVPVSEAKPLRLLQPRWVFDLAQSS